MNEKLITGFKNIDGDLQNLKNGSLITITARPNMGKTSFINSICENLLKSDKNILFFTPSIDEEMTTT